MIRIFWLKTNTVNSNVSEYFPDFGALSVTKAEDGLGQAPVRPPEPIEEIAPGWRTYLTATRGLSQFKPADQSRCLSACSLLYVGGVDRHGIALVHRPRPLQNYDLPGIIHTTLPARQAYADESIRAYLEYMGAGADLIQKTESIPSAEIRSALAPRFPPEISHLLMPQCGTDVDELENQELRIRATLANAYHNR